METATATATKRQIEYADGRRTEEFSQEYIERRVNEHEQEIRNNGANELKTYYAELRKKLNIKTTY